MNENEFELNGKTYVAIESSGTCSKCHMYRLGKVACHFAPKCWSTLRLDGRHVIFVEKQND